jgi:thymidylate kinase
MIIVIEGIPGAGKTTVTSKLEQELGAVIIPEIIEAKIDYTKLSVIEEEEFFLKNDIKKSKLAERAHGKNEIIVIDRHYVSTLAYNYAATVTGLKRTYPLAPKMVKDVLKQDKIIFFSNTEYFSHQSLLDAREKGFKIIQLLLPRKDMEARNKHRIAHQGYDDLSMHFDRMEAYQKVISEKKLVDRIIMTNKSIENVAKELTDFLSY